MFEERINTLSDTAVAVWELLTSEPNGPIWTRSALMHVLNKSEHQIDEALNELFLEEYIKPCVHVLGWRRV